MKKKIIIVSVAVLFILSIIVLGFGSGNQISQLTSGGMAQNENSAKSKISNFLSPLAPSTSTMYDADQASQANNAGTALTSGNITETVQNAILSQRKVIRNANISVEVENFDVSYGKIKSMINGTGYIQEASIRKDKVYKDSKLNLVTSGVIVIRVDRDKFDTVISDIKGLGLLVDENIKSDDVTDRFFDTESRLKLLKYEESRLLEYLNKINDPDTIFKTESRLTEIRHEIEGLTGTLQKMNDLVQLSTITINMTDKGSDIAENGKTFWQKLSSTFMGSLKGVLGFCESAIIFIVKIIPALVLIGILGVIGFIIYKKTLKGKLPCCQINKEKEIEK